MSDLFQNLRIAFRVLRNSPGFTAVAVLTLGVAIAANTTVFSWVDAILLQPISGVARPQELAAVEEISPEGEAIQCAHPDFRDFQRQLTLVSGVVASHVIPFTIGREDDAQRVYGQVVSANFFAILGVKPAIGRLFTPAEDRDDPGAFPLAVISHRLWQMRYHGDPGVVGRVARVNGRQLTIIGVTRPEFLGTMSGLVMDVWVPLSMIQQVGGINTWAAADRRAKCFDVLVRLKPGVRVAQVRAEAEAVGSRMASAYPKTHNGFRATALPLWKGHNGAQFLLLNPLRILMGVSILVLLIACANVANLLMARSVTRQREFGIRMAMGAGRARLIQQLLTEVLLLAGGGALIGLSIAQWAGELLTLLLPSTNLPLRFVMDPLKGSVSGRVLLFTVLACVGAAFLSALMPIVYSGRVNVHDTLKESGRSGMSGAHAHRARAVLVVVEVALAAVALIGAGLFARSFRNARMIDPGFDQRNTLIARLYLGSSGYSRQQEINFDRILCERLQSAPGVEGATYADWVPLWFGDSPWEDLHIEGYPTQHEAGIKMSRILVAPGYFRQLRIPVLSGREFTAQDDEKAQGVVIVNQAFARRYFAGRDPVGRKVQVSGKWRNVVGMVRDFKQGSPAEPPKPYFYVPFQQRFGTGHNNFMYVRSLGNPDALRATLRKEIAALDPAGRLYDVMPFSEYTQSALYPMKIAAVLLAVLGGLSMLLAAVGLYSVMAYAVSERTHEIGIRMALGAQPRSVLGMVLRRGLTMTAAGLAAGIVASLALARLVESLLVQVSAADPLTFLAAGGFLATVALVATYVPAYRATRLDPLAALRCE